MFSGATRVPTDNDGDESDSSTGRASLSLGKLFSSASRDFSSLIRNEIALAKAELRDDLKSGVAGGALFAVAALFGLLAIVLLSFAAVYGIVAAGLHVAWAFLIVAGVYLLIAGIAAAVGAKRLKKVGPPKRAIRLTKESVAVIKDSARGR